MSTALAEATALLGVYGHRDLMLVSGSGAYVVDAAGRSYLDFTSGIGVNALGHGSDIVETAVLEALRRGLVHTSNLFRTGPAEELAELLVDLSFPGQVFFANSGAEAVEAALKFSRRWAASIGGGRKHEIVAFRRGFHGRLFGSLAITDRPGYQAPFRPLMPGAHIVGIDDARALATSVTRERTAAVIIEPVQGEGGVHPMDAAFLRDLRTLCTEQDVALIFDEIQCGLGRTGTVFAYERAGVEPDAVTLAKPLAGGLPMGAVVLSDRIAATVHPGDHATTFGGGPLVSTVALGVLRHISTTAFLSEVRRLGGIVREWAARLVRVQGVVSVRGAGLMWGIELSGDAQRVVTGCRDRGLLVLSAGANVVRLLPPLNIAESELRDGLDTVASSLP